jgi:hypothetical protein
MAIPMLHSVVFCSIRVIFASGALGVILVFNMQGAPLRASFTMRLFAGLLAWLIAAGRCLAIDAAVPQVWLSGVDPFVRQAMKAGASDYNELFRPDAPWRVAATHVSVFKTSTQWILNGSDEELTRMFVDLRGRGIALAIEALMLTRENDKCGRGVEGYSGPGTIRRAAERIQALGGQLAYIAMDEPLWFGHSYRGPQACQASLPYLARDIARTVKDVKAVFPNVKVGDIEPLPQSSQADWVGTIMEWAAEFESAVGVPLAFFDMDVDWVRNWDADVSRLARELAARGVKFGIIYNGNPNDPDDQTWTRNAEVRFDAIEGRLGIIPDQAILQTWMVHPTHMLPETRPGTMTNLVMRYARTRTSLKFQARDGRLVGILTDRSGHPLSNAAVSIMVIEDGRSGRLTVNESSGTVPPAASSAVVALRLNTECECSGSGEVGVGTVSYADDGGSKAERPLKNANATENNLQPDAPTQFIATAGSPILVNSKSFPVSPGHSYRLKVPMRATRDAAGAGYVALAFLGPDGNEIKRDRVPITQGESRRVVVSTDLNGYFQYGGITNPQPGAVEAVFLGDEKFRAITAPLELTSK